MNIQPTPAVASRRYEMTPIGRRRGVHDVSPRSGLREPQFLRIVVNADGTPLEKFVQTHLALDPRAAFWLICLLKES